MGRINVEVSQREKSTCNTFYGQKNSAGNGFQEKNQQARSSMNKIN